MLENIRRIELAKKEKPDAWGIFFDDGTVAPRNYYNYWLLVQYCLDIKEMTYLELLSAEIPEASIKKEMNEWYLNVSRKSN